MGKDKNLKSCPFCGNTYVKISPRYNEFTGEVYFYMVECIVCYAKLGNQDRDKAVIKWNTRKG